MLLVVGLVQGAGAEVGVRLTPVTAGTTGGSSSVRGRPAWPAVLGMVRFGWLTQDWFAWRLGLQVASGILLCGVAAR